VALATPESRIHRSRIQNPWIVFFYWDDETKIPVGDAMPVSTDFSVNNRDIATVIGETSL
jgi:hypothetical protein